MHEGISPEKGGEESAEFGGGDGELVFQEGGGDGEIAAIDVVDEDGEREQDEDDPEGGWNAPRMRWFCGGHEELGLILNRVGGESNSFVGKGAIGEAASSDTQSNALSECECNDGGSQIGDFNWELWRCARVAQVA